MRARIAIAGVAVLSACNLLNGSGNLEIGPITGIAEDAGASAADAGASDAPSDMPDASVDAAADAFFGTGRSGALVVSTGAMQINSYETVTAAAKAGDTTVAVEDTTLFGTGELILLWQATGLANAVSGTQTPVSLSKNSVGHYELARLAGKVSPRLLLLAPLAFDYPSDVSQVVRVPEYTDVTIAAASRIVGAAWNGRKGGVVAFLATGTVLDDGDIAADGLGFRGGVGIQGPGGLGCSLLDGTPATGYAAKGEGIALGGYGAGIGGRGNLANGGGGGNCHNGGGGGGGHGGAGGAGGTSDKGMSGLGGAPLAYASFYALLMGGGGAAGDDNNGAPFPGGGSGGGAVLVSASSIRGSGTISASGASGLPAPGNDGAGGGGAGGGVLLRAATVDGVRIQTQGGPGASSVSGASGGGGGGGVIAASATSFRASTLTAGGDAGTGVALNASSAGAPGRADLP